MTPRVNRRGCVLVAVAVVNLAACGGGDPFGEQPAADIERAELESTFDFQEGFVSRWEDAGQPKFASCIILSFQKFRNAKIFPHGGGAVSIGLGDDFREQAEWREYCSHPVGNPGGGPNADASG